MSQRIAIYARVSTLHNQNPEMQLGELREYAARRGWEITPEYVDIGVSGSKESRPELNRMIAAAHARKFETVVCWKFDRLGRSLKHLVTTIEDLSAYGVAFVSLRDNLDLSTPTGRLLLHIIGAMAQFERELIKERVSAGMHAAAHAINREIGVLQQIMREFDQWQRLETRHRQLSEPPSRAGHSLTAEEEKHLREVAFTKKKWYLAGHCMTIMLSTTMGFGELRQLTRGDVNMDRKCVTVREGAKNAYRRRTIPLNTTAYDSMTWILERWAKRGGASQALHPASPAKRTEGRALEQRNTMDLDRAHW